MTFKSLLHLGGFGKLPWDIPSEHYHNHYHGAYNRGGHGGSSKKGGNGAALSALTLLAFLFLLNVMQQSLQDNNSTAPTTTAAFLIRETDQLPIVLDSKKDNNGKTEDDIAYTASTYGSKTEIKDYVRVRYED